MRDKLLTLVAAADSVELRKGEENPQPPSKLNIPAHMPDRAGAGVKRGRGAPASQPEIVLNSPEELAPPYVKLPPASGSAAVEVGTPPLQPPNPPLEWDGESPLLTFQSEAPPTPLPPQGSIIDFRRFSVDRAQPAVSVIPVGEVTAHPAAGPPACPPVGCPSPFMAPPVGFYGWRRRASTPAAWPPPYGMYHLPGPPLLQPPRAFPNRAGHPVSAGGTFVPTYGMYIPPQPPCFAPGTPYSAYPGARIRCRHSPALASSVDRATDGATGSGADSAGAAPAPACKAVATGPQPQPASGAAAEAASLAGGSDGAGAAPAAATAADGDALLEEVAESADVEEGLGGAAPPHPDWALTGSFGTSPPLPPVWGVMRGWRPEAPAGGADQFKGPAPCVSARCFRRTSGGAPPEVEAGASTDPRVAIEGQEAEMSAPDVGPHSQPHLQHPYHQLHRPDHHLHYRHHPHPGCFEVGVGSWMHVVGERCSSWSCALRASGREAAIASGLLQPSPPPTPLTSALNDGGGQPARPDGATFGPDPVPAAALAPAQPAAAAAPASAGRIPCPARTSVPAAPLSPCCCAQCYWHTYNPAYVRQPLPQPYWPQLAPFGQFVSGRSGGSAGSGAASGGNGLLRTRSAGSSGPPTAAWERSAIPPSPIPPPYPYPYTRPRSFYRYSHGHTFDASPYGFGYEQEYGYDWGYGYGHAYEYGLAHQRFPYMSTYMPGASSPVESQQPQCPPEQPQPHLQDPLTGNGPLSASASRLRRNSTMSAGVIIHDTYDMPSAPAPADDDEATRGFTTAPAKGACMTERRGVAIPDSAQTAAGATCAAAAAAFAGRGLMGGEQGSPWDGKAGAFRSPTAVPPQTLPQPGSQLRRLQSGFWQPPHDPHPHTHLMRPGHGGPPPTPASAAGQLYGTAPSSPAAPLRPCPAYALPTGCSGVTASPAAAGTAVAAGAGPNLPAAPPAPCSPWGCGWGTTGEFQQTGRGSTADGKGAAVGSPGGSQPMVPRRRSRDDWEQSIEQQQQQLGQGQAERQAQVCSPVQGPGRASGGETVGPAAGPRGERPAGGLQPGEDGVEERPSKRLMAGMTARMNGLRLKL